MNVPHKLDLDPLPSDFDLLHPCCQKDLLEARYTDKLLSTLRSQDRSNQWLNQRRLFSRQLKEHTHRPHQHQHQPKSGYFSTGKGQIKCHSSEYCGCDATTITFNKKNEFSVSDYPALHQVRLQSRLQSRFQEKESQPEDDRDEVFLHSQVATNTSTSNGNENRYHNDNEKEEKETFKKNELNNQHNNKTTMTTTILTTDKNANTNTNDGDDSDDSDFDEDDEVMLEIERIQRFKLLSQMSLNSSNNNEEDSSLKTIAHTYTDTDKDIGTGNGFSSPSTTITAASVSTLAPQVQSIDDFCAPTLASLLDLLHQKDCIALSHFGYLVIHLYDPNSTDCGYLDLILEELVPLYPGTCFLRCNLHEANAKVLKMIFPETTDCQSSSSLHGWKSGRKNQSRSDDMTSSYDSRYHYPALVPFFQGEKKHTFRLRDFFSPCLRSFIGDEYTVKERNNALRSEVEKVLTRCHILESELQVTLSSSSNSFFQVNNNGKESNKEAEDDNDEEEYYDCGIPGCYKTFFHQHVNAEKQMLPEFNGLLN